MPDQRLFEQMAERGFGDDVCFFCATPLDAGNRTREHVIPRWVQRAVNLWDQELTLLNGTTLKYRQLVVPACLSCNGAHLSQIEMKISEAFAGGIDGLLSLDRKTVYLWLSKIFYGILYREHLLPLDRISGMPDPIVEGDLLRSFSAHHFFLQAARYPIRFDEFFPASIFFFQLRDDQGIAFDFKDSPVSMTIAIRVNGIGIVAALQDGRTQELMEWGANYERLRAVPLSHEQFVEVYCRVHYAAMQMNRVPKYIILKHDREMVVMQMPLQGMSTKPIFDPMDVEQYATVLAFHQGLTFDEVFLPPADTVSWLAPLEADLQHGDDIGDHD